MMIPAVGFTNCSNFRNRQNLAFKNSSSDLITSASVSSSLSTSDVISLIEESERKDKKNQMMALGLISIGTLAGLLLVPKIATKGTSTVSNNAIELSYTFKSLKNNNEIPTLETCKSINKKLKDFLQNQVDYFNASPEILKKTGMPTAANRLLMHGEPGTGKSYFAKILAKTLDADYMEIKYSDLNKQYCGEHIENVKNIFENIIKTAQNSPEKKFVVNLNEIDSIAQSPQVLQFGGGSHNTFKLEERSVFLTYIEDLADKTPNVILIGSTNISPKNTRLDEAVLSRFKNIIEVNSPDKTCMFEALKMHIKALPEGDKFIKDNEKALEAFAQTLVDRKASFRDLNCIISNSKNYYLKDAIKDKNCTYKLEYLEKAQKTLEMTDGEIVGKNKK